MKELIAQATSCKDKAELVKFLKDQSANETLSKSIRSKFEYLLTRENADFRAFRTRVINFLQIEEKSAQVVLDQDDLNDDNPKQPNTRKVDHKTALREINETIEVYIRNALDQIAQHKEDPKKNNKEANIIALVHGLNELLDNPEHKQYINLDERLFCDVVKLQNALNEIGLGETYKPIHYLFSLQHKELSSFSTENSGKEVVVQLLEAAIRDPELLKTLCAPDKDRSILLHLIRYASLVFGLLELQHALNEIGLSEVYKYIEYFLFSLQHKDVSSFSMENSGKEVVVQLLVAAKRDPELLKILCAPDRDSNILRRLISGALACGLLELQHALNEIGLGEVYKPLEYLFVFNKKSFSYSVVSARNELGSAKLIINLQDVLGYFIHNPRYEAVKALIRVSEVHRWRSFIHGGLDPFEFRETLVLLVMRYGYKEVATMLLEVPQINGVSLKDLFSLHRFGKNLLLWAVRYGYKEVATMLLEAAQINGVSLKDLFSPNEYGDRQLHEALRSRDKNVVVWLLEAAKGNQELLQMFFSRDNLDMSPLHAVLMFRCNKEFTIILLDAVKGNPELLTMLLSPNLEGRTPLHIAASYCARKEEVALVLSAVERNPELLKTLFAPDRNGQTPLHLAAIDVNDEVVGLLLKAAKRNQEFLKTLIAPDRNGQTPLHHAASDKKVYRSSERDKIVVLLLKSVKRNPELLKILFAPDVNGCTPQQLAKSAGCKKLAKMLLKKDPATALLDKSWPCKSVLDELLPSAGCDFPNQTLSNTAAITMTASTDGAQVLVPPSIAQQVTRSSSSGIGKSRG